MKILKMTCKLFQDVMGLMSFQKYLAFP